MNERKSEPLVFRITYGYGNSDYIRITEKDLERAMYAWQTGAIFNFGSKSRKGTEFKGIDPDFRHYTGWSDSYQPKDSEDFKQLRRDMPEESEFEKRKQLANARVEFILNSGRNPSELLSNPENIDRLLLN